MNRASFSTYLATHPRLRWTQSRRFAVVSIVGVSGFGLWLLFLAAIGFHYRMVPSDALAHMEGRYEIVRWLDEAMFGIPVEIFYSWLSLCGGLAVCAFAIYSAYHLPPSTHDSEARSA